MTDVVGKGATVLLPADFAVVLNLGTFEVHFDILNPETFFSDYSACISGYFKDLKP